MASRRHWTGSLAALIAPVPLKATDPPKPRARTWMQASAPARLELLMAEPSTPGGRGGSGSSSGQPTTTTPTTVGLQLRLMTGQVMLRCEDLAQTAGGSGGAGCGLSLALVRGSGGGGGGGGGGNNATNAPVPWLLFASSSSSSLSPSKPTCHLVFRFFDPADGADFAQGLAAIARQRLAAAAAAAQPPSSLLMATAATAALVSAGQRAVLESAIRRAVANRAPADEALAALEQDLAAQAMAAARPTDGEQGCAAVVAATAAAASSSSSSAEQQLEALVALVDAMWTEAESRRKQQARPPQKRKAGQS